MTDLFQSSVSAADFVKSHRKHFSDKDAAAIIAGKAVSTTLTKVQIDGNKASQFVNEMSSFLQRRVSDEHVRKLYFTMIDNKFDSEIDPIYVFIFQGQAFFAGGYHRMIAQKYTITKDEPNGFSYPYTIVVRSFTDFESMQAAYTLTHARKAASRSEVNEMALFDQSDITQQGKRNTLVSAVKIIINRDWDPQMKYVPRDISDAAATTLAKDYMAEAVKVNDIIYQAGTDPEFKRRFVGVPYAAMLVLMRTQPGRTTAFLERARTTALLTPDSPELHFHNWVRTRATTSGEKGRAKQVEEFGYIWYKFSRGENFKRIAPAQNGGMDYTRLAGVPERPRGIAVRVTDSKLATLQNQIRRQAKVLTDRKEAALTEWHSADLRESDRAMALAAD